MNQNKNVVVKISYPKILKVGEFFLKKSIHHEHLEKWLL